MRLYRTPLCLRMIPPALPLVASSDSEKLILRLAITHGILLKIGFLPERIEECLRACASWELEEALDWVSLNSTEDLLKEAVMT